MEGLEGRENAIGRGDLDEGWVETGGKEVGDDISGVGDKGMEVGEGVGKGWRGEVMREAGEGEGEGEGTVDG